MTSDIMAHAIAALDQVGNYTALSSFADHLLESQPDKDPWAEALQSYLNGDEDALHELVGTTPHYATVGASKEGMILALNGRLYPPKRIGQQYINSLTIPVYRYRPRSVAWWRTLPVMRVMAGIGRVRRIEYCRWSSKKIPVEQVAWELFDVGGMGNLIHAVLGVHYFVDGKCQNPSPLARIKAQVTLKASQRMRLDRQARRSGRHGWPENFR